MSDNYATVEEGYVDRAPEFNAIKLRDIPIVFTEKDPIDNTMGAIPERTLVISSSRLGISQRLPSGDFIEVGSGYGSFYDYAQDNGVSTSTVTSNTEKLRLTYLAETQGFHKLCWSYQFNSDSTSQDFRAHIRQNGTIIFDHREEPKDVAGNFGATGTNQKKQISGFLMINLFPGVNTFQLRWRTSSAGVNASIWNVNMDCMLAVPFQSP